MKLLLPLLAFAVAAGGCGDSESGGSAIPSEGMIFEYSRAGGLAFSLYEVTIEADGSGLARFGSDVRRLKEEEFTLSGAEIEELRSILEEHPISELPEGGDIVCADCFEYSYSYGGDEITLSDGSETVAELSELANFLGTLPLPADQPNGG